MADIFLLFDESTKEYVSSTLLPLFEETVLPCVFSADKIPEFVPESIVYLYISDQQAPIVIEAAIKNSWFLAFLPHPEARYLGRGFCIEKDIEKAVTDVLQSKPRKVDALRCNGELILSSVSIGHVFQLSPDIKNINWQTKIKSTWSNIRHIFDFLPKKLSFTTGQDATFETAALGVVVVEHGHRSLLSRNIITESHINDGMFQVLILAPRSVMGMLRYFIRALFGGSTKRPQFIGLLKTQAITISNHENLEYKIDGKVQSAKTLEIETEHRVLNLLVSTDFPITDGTPNGKEERKVSSLPAGEAITAMASHPLPFIAHAATEEFKELYQLLRENAVASPVFLTLMVLSTLLASIGLYANSTPVIIGAMILAPLMAPIISLSMALTRQDSTLLTSSIKTLFLGLCTALIFAAIASFILPMEIVTSEISDRLSPSLLDLGVAVISGVAGAYAHARVSVAKSMAGVAIAVALVPPLAVTGIGLGWLDFHIAWGALLLFLTNLAGIVFAASITFLTLGFAPFKRAKKGLMIALIAVILVSIPLVISFIHLSDEAEIVKKLQGETIGNVAIRTVNARAVKPLELSLQLVTPTALTNTDLDNIKARIEDKLQRKVVMEAQVVIRR